MKAHCPCCGRILEICGPIQNDSDNYHIKKTEVKCQSCPSFGKLWEITTQGETVQKIEFKKALFYDFDHK